MKETMPALSGRHEPKPLPFDPTKLTGISEKLIRSHWENNYGGAVKALNIVEQKLDELLGKDELPPYIYGDLKREELVRTGSVVLHELYFASLGGDGKPSGKAQELIEKWFGHYDRWEAEFRKIAVALLGGSGWAILSYNLHTREAHNCWGLGPHAQRTDGYPPSCARHVRARLPYGLRRSGYQVCRRIHAEHQLE